MVGTLWGTDSWFHPANGHWYGRSSGPVSEPYGDGLCFVNHVVIGETSPLIDEV